MLEAFLLLLNQGCTEAAAHAQVFWCLKAGLDVSDNILHPHGEQEKAKGVVL